MTSEVSKMLQLICDEKGLDPDIVMEALEQALAAAYRKDFGHRQQNLTVKFDPDTGDMKVWDIKEVVDDIDEAELEAAQEELTKRREAAAEEDRELTEEETEDLVRFNPKTQMMLSEAKEHDKKIKVGDTLKIDLEVPADFGRMAAQTAKQVIIQKLREAERNSVFEDFKEEEGQIVQGIIQRRGRSGEVIVDLGKITGLLLQSEQIRREQYRPGNRMQFYVMSVEMGTRGPQIMLSRSHTDMVRTVFESEIPEVATGVVEIKGIARDAGNRSKVAVYTEDDTIDPIGSCIGQRGSRITTIIDNLGGEKIDVIQWSEDTVDYIKQALSPAKVEGVELDEETKEANVTVPADQFSLAIGREGQNVRLAAELTGWKINVVQEGGEQDGEDVQADNASSDATDTEATDAADDTVDEKSAEESTDSETSTVAPSEESKEEKDVEKEEEKAEESSEEEASEEDTTEAETSNEDAEDKEVEEKDDDK